MSETRKVISSTLGVISLMGALAGGVLWRQNQDHATSDGRPDLMGYLAAKTTDAQISEVEFFKEMSLLIKREYVDPVSNDQKLASGAVRGMIQSLGDVNSQFMDPTQFQIFKRRREGKYEGIGAELALRMDSGLPKSSEVASENLDDGQPDAVPAIQVPQLVVIDVVPGGPAEKAGMRPGDVIDSVNGRWILNAKALIDFRKAQQDLRLNKITRAQYASIHKEIRLKNETSILATRAKERLSSGETGSIDVAWFRNGKPMQAKMDKAVTQLKPFEASVNSVSRLNFGGDAAEQFSAAVSKMSGTIIIDLRHNVTGDYEVMRKCLVAVLPAGTYGYLTNLRDQHPKPFLIGKGVTRMPELNLVVDRTTLGPARTFATILKKYAKARITGDLPAGDTTVMKVVSLPDGSGYTLMTAVYRADPPKQAAAPGTEDKA